MYGIGIPLIAQILAVMGAGLTEGSLLDCLKVLISVPLIILFGSVVGAWSVWLTYWITFPFGLVAALFVALRDMMRRHPHSQHGVG